MCSPARETTERQELEARLRRPDEGENGYVPGAEALSRLEALRRLRDLAESGSVEVSGRRGGVNTHVHTSKSFSFFSSPSDAVWQAWLAGIDVLGINDHYTTAGHEEFGEACRIVGILPAYSMEAVAMWEEAEARGLTVNDPSNPGRTYLTAKGVTRELSPRSRGYADLRRMHTALLERNRELTARLSRLLEERLSVRSALSFDDVLALTPHNQPTERHVAEAVARFLRRYEESAERLEMLGRLVAESPPADVVDSDALLQDYLRARLIKRGRPAYVEESRDAFIPVERMVSLALDLGAIPTYPVLGDPVTPWEEDLEVLLDRVEELGVHALEVIPDRNRRERLRAIVEAAARRHLPVFNGTEHNTRATAPLVDRYFFDGEFREHFERGARVLLGHQELRRRGEPGFVDGNGSVPARAREAHLRRVEAAGSEVFPSS